MGCSVGDIVLTGWTRTTIALAARSSNIVTPDGSLKSHRALFPLSSFIAIQSARLNHATFILVGMVPTLLDNVLESNGTAPS